MWNSILPAGMNFCRTITWSRIAGIKPPPVPLGPHPSRCPWLYRQHRGKSRLLVGLQEVWPWARSLLWTWLPLLSNGHNYTVCLLRLFEGIKVIKTQSTWSRACHTETQYIFVFILMIINSYHLTYPISFTFITRVPLTGVYAFDSSSK